MTMKDPATIREHMEVVGLDGKHVGTVDHANESTIKLTKTDAPDGQHHFLSTSLVGSVDSVVHLSVGAEEAMQQWTTNDPASA